MEAIVTVVGFLGAGKTTLLKHLTTKFLEEGWQPFVVLNDYENANLDAQQFIEQMDAEWVKPLSGSCICCSGLNELRNFVNRVPEREKGITLIEANGTSDASSLMGFLGIGIEDRFLPPIQISVVDAKNWQKRDEHNELEGNQIQVSSIIVLTHLEGVSEERKAFVIRDVQRLNPYAKILTIDELDIALLPDEKPSENKPGKMEHHKAHWSSCSIDLAVLPDEEAIHDICQAFPDSILRVKGCALIGDNPNYIYFERTPDGSVTVKPFNGYPPFGTKLLTVGVGSEVGLLNNVVDTVLSKYSAKVS